MRHASRIFVTTPLLALMLTGHPDLCAAEPDSSPADRAISITSRQRRGSGDKRALRLITPDGRQQLDVAFELPPHTVLIVTDLIVEPNVVGILPFPGLTRGGCWLQVVMFQIRALCST